MPPTQLSPVAQGRLHAPQLRTSFCRITHVPLQLVWKNEKHIAVQLLKLQTGVAPLQTWLHAPQFAWVFVRTHWLLQRTVPPVHAQTPLLQTE